MLIVNLISARRAEQARARFIGEMLIRAMGAITLFAIAWVVFGYIALQGMNNEAVRTDLQKISFQQQADEVRQLRAENALMAPRVQMVKTAGRRLDYWRWVYGQVARSLPEDARLEGIDATNPPPTPSAGAPAPGVPDVSTGVGHELTLTGRANGAQTTSQFFLALNTQPAFTDVVMGPVNLSEPHATSLAGKVSVRPLPENAAPAPTTGATGAP